jgi:hypothetical protein
MSHTNMTESATMSLDDKLWRIEFGVEVSTLYHDWRRSSLGTLVNIVRTVALISAVISLSAGFVNGPRIGTVVAIAGALAAIVLLADLVFQFDSRARTHDDLYRRFKALQADIARHSALNGRREPKRLELTNLPCIGRSMRLAGIRWPNEPVQGKNTFAQFLDGRVGPENICLCISVPAIFRREHNSRFVYRLGSP